jgi:hypothetical protein
MIPHCAVCGLPKKILITCSFCKKKVCIDCMGDIHKGLCTDCFVDEHFKTLKNCYTKQQIRIKKLTEVNQNEK